MTGLLGAVACVHAGLSQEGDVPVGSGSALRRVRDAALSTDDARERYVRLVCAYTHKNGSIFSFKGGLMFFSRVAGQIF